MHESYCLVKEAPDDYNIYLQPFNFPKKLPSKNPLLYECLQIAFQVLVKALISLDPGEEMELLKKQFQEFIAGLMSLPLNIPGSQLYRSLQAS